MQLIPHILITTHPLTSRDELSGYVANHWPQLRPEHITWFPEELEESVKIETVRDLQKQLQYTTVGELHLVIIANLDGASLPAQQALLKTLEEPPANTQIVVTSRQVGLLPATILSRGQLEYLSIANDAPLTKAAELYQQLNTGGIPEVLQLASQYTKKDAALQILDELIRYLHSQSTAHSQLNSTLHLASLLVAYERVWLNHNPRLILEQLWLQWLTNRP